MAFGAPPRCAARAARRLRLRPWTTIARTGVVGLGTMGAGIAQVLLEGGCEVVGHELDDAALERARERIEAGLAKRVEKGRLSDEQRRGGARAPDARARARRRSPAASS